MNHKQHCSFCFTVLPETIEKNIVCRGCGKEYTNPMYITPNFYNHPTHAGRYNQMNIHELRTEGDRAVEDLEFFTQHELGYKREVFRFCSPIEKLLSDNSGLIETIHDWIKDNLLEECPYCDNYCPSLDEDDVCEEYFTEVLGGHEEN